MRPSFRRDLVCLPSTQATPAPGSSPPTERRGQWCLHGALLCAHGSLGSRGRLVVAPSYSPCRGRTAVRVDPRPGTAPGGRLCGQREQGRAAGPGLHLARVPAWEGGGRALTLAADPGSLDGLNWEKRGGAQKKWERAALPPDRGAGRPSASRVPFCNPLARFTRRKKATFLLAQLASRLHFHVLNQLTAPGGWGSAVLGALPQTQGFAG